MSLYVHLHFLRETLIQVVATFALNAMVDQLLDLFVTVKNDITKTASMVIIAAAAVTCFTRR